MLWNEITIHTTEEAIEMISNFLHEAGAGGFPLKNPVRSTSRGIRPMDSGMIGL